MTGFPQNIFVLCTGRCGSTTLAKACAHLTNFSSGHETRCHMVGPSRFDFAPRHIEIDNRLSWLLGRLERKWGNSAGYVHLTRDPEAVAASFARRAEQGIMRAYKTDILMRAAYRSSDVSLIDFCRDYVDTVTENIAGFLKDKQHVMSIHLESIADDFDRFCVWAGATGDLAAAQGELRITHNASENLL